METNKLELKEGAIWLNNTMKNALQEVYDHYRSVVNRIEWLEEENKRLKSETYKDEELAKMKTEYEEMKKAFTLGFPIDEKEHEAIMEWMNTLPKTNTGAIGGRFTYEFYCTSIGTVASVKDGVTGEKFTFRDL